MHVDGRLWLLGMFMVLAVVAPRVRQAVLARIGQPSLAPSGRLRPRPILDDATDRAAWEFLNGADLGQSHVFAKVRLEDIVAACGEDLEARSVVHECIGIGPLDFVLTDRAYRPIMVVEVDRGRLRQVQGHRAMTKRRILTEARVPLLRLRVGTDWQAAVRYWQGGQWHKKAGA